jgi:glycosyltransferase involved in cell wall biosynthesis
MHKKIVVLTRSTSYHFKSGGMETQLRNLLSGLAEKDYQIDVITTGLSEIQIIDSGLIVSQNNESYEIEENGIKYYFLKDTTPGLRPLTSYEKIFVSLKILKRTKNEGSDNFFSKSLKFFEMLNQTRKYDLVISQSTSGQGVINSQIFSNLRIPSISIIHGSIKAELSNRLKSNKTVTNWIRFILIDIPVMTCELITTNKLFFKNITKIVVVSNAIKTNLISDHPWVENKIEVIYNGVDAKVFKPSLNKFNIFTLLYVGRMDREKGIDIIIRTAPILLEKGLKFNLVMIGSGVHLGEFKKQIKASNLDRVIDVKGDMKNTQITEYYSKSHLFIFPTRRKEGHPMTISEAFCSGLPVVATRSGGLSELIYDGKTGLFIKKENHQDLADKIIYLYNNPNILHNLSKNAYKKGLEEFSQSAMVDKYIKLIEKI